VLPRPTPDVLACTMEKFKYAFNQSYVVDDSDYTEESSVSSLFFRKLLLLKAYLSRVSIIVFGIH